MLKRIQRKLVRLRKDWPEKFSDYQLEHKIKISREWIRFLEGRRKEIPGKKNKLQSPSVLMLHQYVKFFGQDLEWLFQTIPGKYRKHPDSAIHDDLQRLLEAGAGPSIRAAMAGLKTGFLKDEPSAP